MSITPQPNRWHHRDVLAAGVLVVIGVGQIAADLAGLPLLKAAISAWGASPAPKVFSSVEGLETFSTKFRLEWRHPDGSAASAELAPEMYERLEGPYSRRNVYGAALAYSPILAGNSATRQMFEAIARYAFCRPDGLVEELGLGPAKGPYRIVLIPKRSTTPESTLSLEHRIECDDRI